MHNQKSPSLGTAKSLRLDPLGTEVLVVKRGIEDLVEHAPEVDTAVLRIRGILPRDFLGFFFGTSGSVGGLRLRFRV